jgi:hypothetical protein
MKIDEIEYKEPRTGAWDKYSLYQFSSKGTVNGIIGNTDLNFTHLSLSELTGKTPPSSSLIEHILKPVFTKYSQNDPVWKNFKIGDSSLSVGDYGCLISCIATLSSYFGENKTPGELCRIKKLFTPSGLVIWKKIDEVYKTMRFLYRYYQFNERVADDALLKDPNKCIIFQVDNKKHWVSALKKVYGGYVCHNPWSYPASNKTYKFREITGMAALIHKF